jgi:hypothetical protein
VGIKWGSQVAGHALRAGIVADPGRANHCANRLAERLNTLRSDRMLAAVEMRCPALPPIVALAYTQPSHLLFHQALRVVIHSRNGVLQGDILGPLLFALTLQGPLEQVAAINLARPLAYADDSFLQEAPEPTVQDFHALLTLAGPFGLHPQLNKYAVYSADASAAASVAGQLSVHHAPGWPFGCGSHSRHTSVPGSTCRPLRRTIFATSWRTWKPCHWRIKTAGSSYTAAHSDEWPICPAIFEPGEEGGCMQKRRCRRQKVLRRTECLHLLWYGVFIAKPNHALVRTHLPDFTVLCASSIVMSLLRHTRIIAST